MEWFNRETHGVAGAELYGTGHELVDYGVDRADVVLVNAQV
jgi:hypothetical protein